ncbi:MAG: DUF1010 domain-containing protein [Giesbergeria sp.]
MGFLPGCAFWHLRQFSAFFASSALPPWRCAFSWFAPVVNLGLPVLASGSNRAVKPTCLRQAAYFRSLACSNSASSQPMLLHTAATCSSAPALGRGRRGAASPCWRWGKFRCFSGSVRSDAPCAM